MRRGSFNENPGGEEEECMLYFDPLFLTENETGNVKGTSAFCWSSFKVYWSTDMMALFSDWDAGRLFPQHGSFDLELFELAGSGALVLFMPQVQALLAQQGHFWSEKLAETPIPALDSIGCAMVRKKEVRTIPIEVNMVIWPFLINKIRPALFPYFAYKNPVYQCCAGGHRRIVVSFAS